MTREEEEGEGHEKNPTNQLTRQIKIGIFFLIKNAVKS